MPKTGAYDTPQFELVPPFPTDPYRAGDCNNHTAAATIPKTKAKKAPPTDPAAFTASPVNGITVPLPVPPEALPVPEPADAEAAAPPAVEA